MYKLTLGFLIFVKIVVAITMAAPMHEPDIDPTDYLDDVYNDFKDDREAVERVLRSLLTDGSNPKAKVATDQANATSATSDTMYDEIESSESSPSTNRMSKVGDVRKPNQPRNFFDMYDDDYDGLFGDSMNNGFEEIDELHRERQLGVMTDDDDDDKAIYE